MTETESRPSSQRTQNTIHSHENPTNSCKRHAVRLMDIYMACLILAPLIVVYWRTTWLLMDLYIYPKHLVGGSSICIAIGGISSLLIVVYQRDVMTFWSECNVITSNIIWRICLYPISLSCIAFWRGIWIITGYTTTITLTSFILCHILSFILLSMLRAVGSVVSAPGFYINDLHVSLSTANLAKIPWSNDQNTFINYILNCLLTVAIVGLLVVVYWRGTWLLLDIIFDYDTSNNLHNHLLCYSISCCICIICFMVSRPTEAFLINSESCPEWSKVLLEHAFVYVLGFCSVNIWRSIWYIWDLLFLTESPVQAAVVSHFVSLFLLYIGQGASNISGAPIGCRTHGPNTLEGFYMGSYFASTQPLQKNS